MRSRSRSDRRLDPALRRYPARFPDHRAGARGGRGAAQVRDRGHRREPDLCDRDPDQIDDWIQRFVDILLAFPIIVLALVVVAALRKFVIAGIDVNLIYAIAIPIIPRVARVVRAAALSIRVMPYVDAARAAGYSNTRIIFRHMAPNVVAPYLIMFTAFIAQAILLEASLSFLGLGVTEPTPAWGLMLSGNAADF